MKAPACNRRRFNSSIQRAGKGKTHGQPAAWLLVVAAMPRGMAWKFAGHHRNLSIGDIYDQTARMMLSEQWKPSSL
jgi:hypothetical protein